MNDRGPRRALRIALVAAAALFAAAVAPATGLPLMADIRPANFCHDVEVGTARALRNVKLRRWHDRAALAVAGCLALAVAYGAAAGVQLASRRKRWTVALLSALALGSFLAADFTGKKEAWHLLSPSLSGWSKLPLPPGLPKGLDLSPAHPECDPKIRGPIERRVTQLYWIHAGAGLAMAALALVLGALGTTWRPPRER